MWKVPLLVVKKTVLVNNSRDKIFNEYLDECSEARRVSSEGIEMPSPGVSKTFINNTMMEG